MIKQSAFSLGDGMPFTLSHIAVAAPLARRGLILSAVVVGSMAPDFLYYLRLTTRSAWGHSLEGICLFTLPVALLVLWGFHAFVKRPLLRLVPWAHRRRLLPYAGPFAFWPPRRFLLILVSVLTGIATHLALDSFTHDYGLLTKTFLFLQAEVTWAGGRVMPMCDLLQFVLSCGLLLVMAAQYARWFFQKRTGASLATFLDFRTHLPLYIVLGLVATLPGVLFAYYAEQLDPGPITLRFRVSRFILAFVYVLVVEILLLLAWGRRKRPRTLKAE